MTTTSLLTDHYELTMLDAALRDGTAARPSVFETFARRLPTGRRYGVFAGLDRLLDALVAFRFDDHDLAFLDDAGVVSAPTLRWLADYRFTGDVVTYREGELFFPDSPVLTVAAPFGEAVVLETLALSVLNHDSAIASAAARMVAAARGRPLMEFGSRRTHEQAAPAAARAAWLAGFGGTSNLAAGARYGVPTLGTSAHAYTLVHDDERTTFDAQVDALGADTTLLIDTYDTTDGLDRALAATDGAPGAVRIDSGDLAAEAHRARATLDEVGARSTRIVLSGSLDEEAIDALAGAPADAYGVGTALVTGSGAPTAEFVYKLVARASAPGRPCVPVAKAGGHKATIGGRKAAARGMRHGTATAEIVRGWDAPPPDDARELQVTAVRGGEIVHRPTLTEIRGHHQAALAELPAGSREIAPGEPAIPTRHTRAPDPSPSRSEPQEAHT